jgi:hypothetical protein
MHIWASYGLLCGNDVIFNIEASVQVWKHLQFRLKDVTIGGQAFAKPSSPKHLRVALFARTFQFSMLSAFVILVFIALISYVRIHGKRLFHRAHLGISQTQVSLLDHIRVILNPPGALLPQLLLERSKANARIALALGLTNTFVDPGIVVHGDFVRRSRGLLRGVQANGWTKFHDTCMQVVLKTLEDIPDSTIAFDHFVQTVVLGSILVGLLDIGKDVDQLDLSTLAHVAASINELWTISKSGSTPPPHLSAQLHDYLRCLIPTSAGFENPIDFVVPTWETMWRVCATTIARAQESAGYMSFFHGFLQTDSLTAQDFIVVGSLGFSVRDFVDEVTRLHPPVKRISRLRDNQPATMTCSTSFSGMTDRLWTWVYGKERLSNIPIRVSADVEAALQAPSIWNDDAPLFNPLRHRSTNPQMKDTQKLVFGYGPLRCVAASWAPDAAAVISATILEGCKVSGWEVIRGEKIGGRTGWDGWSVVKRK